MSDGQDDTGGWQEARRERDRVRREEMMSLPVLPARHHGTLAGHDGDVRICASAGAAGEVVAVWTAPQDADATTIMTTTAAGVRYPEPGTDPPVAARITVHDPGLTAVTRIAELTLAHIFVQLMPGGRFLIAGARCRWHEDGPDRNAILYDAGGQVVSEHVLGDGIASLLADSSGHLWAGYFDEGVYGNYGWGRHADGDEPVGASGIVQFSPALEPAWHYPYPGDNEPWEGVNDCYALNVGDECTWTCYDPGYAVIRIKDGTVTGWHSDSSGVGALAVAGTRAALFGGYSPGLNRLAVTELTGDHADLAGEYRVVLPDGQPLPPGTEVTGRGSRLHFLTGTGWYQLDAGDIPG